MLPNGGGESAVQHRDIKEISRSIMIISSVMVICSRVA